MFPDAGIILICFIALQNPVHGNDIMKILIALILLAWGLVFYTYVVFPLLIALFAKLADKRAAPVSSSDDTNLPRVAMVVAAYNEERFLQAKLNNTWEIDYPEDKFELIIGSDGSGDDTAGILKRCTDKRFRCFLFPQRRGKISVLNDLVTQVDADIIVMSDANTMFEPDSIRKMVRHFSDPRVGCVSGKLNLSHGGGVSGEGIYWKYESWIKRNESKLGFIIGCNGGIFALRTELYEPLPASTLVEDFVLSIRVMEKGYEVRFEPSASANEPACGSARAEMIRKIRIGAGGFQALGLTRGLLHPRNGFRAFAYMGHKVLRWCVPFFSIVAFLSTIPLAMHSVLFQAILALQILGGVISIGAYYLSGSRKLPFWTRPVSYFYLMNYALFLGFLRFLFRTQKVTWERAAPTALAFGTEAQGVGAQRAFESGNGG